MQHVFAIRGCRILVGKPEGKILLGRPKLGGRMILK
jgi:hypothetical protein